MSLIRRFVGRSSRLSLWSMAHDPADESGEKERMTTETTLRMDRNRTQWGLVGRDDIAMGVSVEKRIAGIRHRVTVWTLREWTALHPALRPDTATQVGDTWINIRPI